MAVVKKGNRYYPVVYIDGKRHWGNGYMRKKDAEAEERDIRRKLDTGQFVTTTKESLATYLDRWVRDYVEVKCQPRTIENYKTIIEHHLKPKLGRVQLAKLKPIHLNGYFAEMRKAGYSASYQLQHYSVLHRALESAVKWELLGRNVADAVDRPRKEKREMVVVSQEQVDTLLAAAEKTNLYPVVLLGISAGMSRQEILGARWRDVDFKGGVIHVKQAMGLERREDGSGYDIKPCEPKRGRRRTISLPPGTVDYLKWWRTKQKEYRLRAGALYRDHGLICCRYDGSPLDPREVSKRISQLLKKLNLPGTLHGLRHAHITHLIDQGVHLKVISGRAGHAQISTTADIYGHLERGMDERAAQSLQYFKRRPGEAPKPSNETSNELLTSATNSGTRAQHKSQ